MLNLQGRTVGICRLCASLRKVELLQTITDANHEVCRKLRQCCQLDIRMEDALPKSICEECINKLQGVFAFYTKVHESQESLATLFPVKLQNSPFKSETTHIEEELPPAEGAVEVVEPVEPQPITEICPKRLTPTLKKAKVIESQAPSTSGAEVEEDVYLLEVYEMINKNSEVKIKEKHTEKSTGMGQNEMDFKEAENGQESCGAEDQETEMNTFKTIQELVVEKNPDSPMEIILEFENDDEVDDDDGEKDSDNGSFEEHYLTEILDELQTEELSPSQPDAHALTEWAAYKWQCCTCSYTASTYPDLLAHNAQTHDATGSYVQLKCTDCQKICTRYYTFLNHVRLRHHTGLALSCDLCDKRCDDFLELAAHRKSCATTASADYPDLVLCEQCGKAFLSPSGVQIHAKSQHGIARKSVECPTCGKEFNRASSMRAHQRVHSDLREFTCELCGRAFRHKVNLDVHLYSHIDEKPFECLVCKKSFKTSVNLEKHNLLHTGTKDFKCDHCDSFFRTRDAKLSHERTHTGEKPYKCSFCDRLFRFRSTYMNHVHMHTGERPYTCEACNHHFSNWSNYNKHMKRRHKGGEGGETINEKPKSTAKPKPKASPSHPQAKTTRKPSTRPAKVVAKTASSKHTATTVHYLYTKDNQPILESAKFEEDDDDASFLQDAADQINIVEVYEEEVITST